MKTKKHRLPHVLNEPFRSFRKIELAIERARACYCFFQHKVQKRTLRDIAKEQRMSYERVRHLSNKAERDYGLKEKHFPAYLKIQADVDWAH